MNWGYRIVLTFVLFAAFILYMVVQSFRQDLDLVADDYYLQEINYQQKLRQKTNLDNLHERVYIELKNESITLTFPQSQNPAGEIHFYHPFRKLFDKKLAIALDGENSQTVSKEGLVFGRYRVNITWKSGGKEYFQQEKIFIP